MEKENRDVEIDARQIVQALTDDTIGDAFKIQAISHLKKVFNNAGNFNNISLGSLLETAASHHDFKKRDEKFLFGYGSSLIDNLAKKPPFLPKLLLEIEYVLLELERSDSTLIYALIQKLWRRFEKSLIFFPDFVERIITFSKKFLEEVALSWMESPPVEWKVNFFVKMSAHSPKLFQAMTAILYEFICKSEGQARVVELMKLYVNSVMGVCHSEHKDFVGLYPRDCRRLVMLLMMPPHQFPDGMSSEKFVTRSMVGGLLLNLFFDNRKKVLMLLSHYPAWLEVLKNRLQSD